MILVLDASAGIELLLKRPRSSDLQVILEQSSEVLTTTLYQAEVGNVLVKYHRAGFLTSEEVLRLSGFSWNLVDEFIAIEENLTEAVAESIRLNHTVYDLLYLTLARRNGATLVTLDTKLAQLASSEGIKVFPVVSEGM